MAPLPPPPRQRLILGTSLKMYFTPSQTTTYISSILPLSRLASSYNIDLFLIPTFLSLTTASHLLQSSPAPILLGAQDCFWEDTGAFTGEVSPAHLAELGVKIVEIGHAERRRLFGETDEHVGWKVAAACRNNLTPLVCIGEKSRGKVASAAVGAALSELKPQVDAVLSSAPEDADVLLAYEPVWAIGASEPADADHVVHVARGIREMVKGRRGRTRILYGGSAGPGTWERIREGVDGLFLGRFAHDVENLRRVIEEMS